MADANWIAETGSPAMYASSSAAPTPVVTDEIADRTSVITGRLKTIYRKTVLPVEKKYSYDYFYESPLLTDIEFDGTNHENFFKFIRMSNCTARIQQPTTDGATSSIWITPSSSETNKTGYATHSLRTLCCAH